MIVILYQQIKTELVFRQDLNLSSLPIDKSLYQLNYTNSLLHIYCYFIFQAEGNFGILYSATQALLSKRT